MFSTGVALAALVLSARAAGDERLVRFGPGANDTARVSADALELVRFTPPGTQFDFALPALQGAHAGFLSALAARPRKSGPGFIDLTDTPPDIRSVPVAADAPFPTPDASKYPELPGLFARVDAAGLTSTVTSLANFTTRYYRSANARAPALWVQTAFAGAVGADNVVLVENSFDQPNVVGAIPRAEGSDNEEIVIIGAHLDSINQSGGASARAPGADDDASGVAVVLQALQILAAAGFRGARRIEAHAYAGEEGGLLGSARTASQYKSAGKLVRGMLQMDMVGYQKGSKPVITLTNDADASPPLQAFVRALVGAYVPEATFRTAKCGYACTDHYSWLDQGYAGISIDEAGPDDSTLNPYYHTQNDTLDKLNMTKAAVFVNAVLAFAVELSEHAPEPAPVPTTTTEAPEPEPTTTVPTTTDVPAPEPTTTEAPAPEPTTTEVPSPEPTTTEAPAPEPTTTTDAPEPEPTTTDEPEPTSTDDWPWFPWPWPTWLADPDAEA